MRCPLDKRYQVFVSSTYADLQDERQEIMQALLELDCIPAGMELFPAANEDQWTLIKKVIDDCDYYMVIIGGRYGSIGPEGKSYTEMEYNYAMETGKPVLGFIHRDPSTLPAGRCESTDDGKAKLIAFRDIAQQKMCRYWDSPSDLGSQVSRSLIKLIKANPGIGWVRGDQVPDGTAAQEILKLRRQIETLEGELQTTRTSKPEGTEELSQGHEFYTITFSFWASPTGNVYDVEQHQSTIPLTWNDIFSAVSPIMIHEAKEAAVLIELNSLVCDKATKSILAAPQFSSSILSEFSVSPADFQTIKVQLRALGLITMSVSSRSLRDTATYWKLTPYGDNVMTRLRAIRKG